MPKIVGKSNTASEVKAKPFPWRCPKCRKPEVYRAKMSHTSQISHDGRLHTVNVPNLKVPRCRACNELVFDNDADEQISLAFRAQLRMLSPEQIRNGRTLLKLTQKELAERLGVAAETISRWETGALIQSRAMDNLLRVYFAIPQVRSALIGERQDAGLGVPCGVA